MRVPESLRGRNRCEVMLGRQNDQTGARNYLVLKPPSPGIRIIVASTVRRGNVCQRRSESIYSQHPDSQRHQLPHNRPRQVSQTHGRPTKITATYRASHCGIKTTTPHALPKASTTSPQQHHSAASLGHIERAVKHLSAPNPTPPLLNNDV